jgi:hypothetical protein
MEEHGHPQSLDIVGEITRLAARMRAGEVPPGLELEHVLERGFGSLIHLEAQLQKAKRAAGDAASMAQADALQHQIDILRDALIDVQALSTTEGPPRNGYGFVLPSKHR